MIQSDLKHGRETLQHQSVLFTHTFSITMCTLFISTEAHVLNLRYGRGMHTTISPGQRQPWTNERSNPCMEGPLFRHTVQFS